MVKSYTEDGRAGATAPVIPPSDLGEDQVVVFDEAELQLLLLANSEYELDVQGVGETRWSINLPQLEMSLTDRYVRSKLRFTPK